MMLILYGLVKGREREILAISDMMYFGCFYFIFIGGGKNIDIDEDYDEFLVKLELDNEKVEVSAD